MSNNPTLHAEVRTDSGKGSSRRLRKIHHKIPAIVYGNKQSAETIALSYKDIVKITENESFLSTMIDLRYGNKSHRVLIKDMQRHPAKSSITHVDFIRVDQNKPVKVHIPLHFLNTQSCVGVKKQGGIFISDLYEIEIVCLPDHMPPHIEVDVQAMEIGDTLHLKQIKLPEHINLAPASKDFYESSVARVIREQQEKEEEIAEIEENGEEEA